MKPSLKKYTELREKAGVNDATVSKETKITISTFSDWRGGRSAPGVEKLAKLAKFFDVSIEDLLEGD